LRNTLSLRRAFERIRNYRTLLEQPHYVGLDEVNFSAIFVPTGFAA